ELANALSHWRYSPQLKGFSGPCVAALELVACARWGRADVCTLLPLSCLGLDGEIPVRTAGKDEQASSVTRAGGGNRQRPRKPDRRCFKPRPLLRAECAGFASGCQSDFLESLALLSRRLAGLLSGYLPTDTRPQARAKLGTTEISNFGDTCKRISSNASKLSQLFLLSIAMSSTARAEGLDAVCGADELRHEDKATEHEHHVEDPRAEAAEVEQGGDGPGAGERGAEHLRADKDGGADNGNDVKPDDAAALGHAGFP